MAHVGTQQRATLAQVVMMRLGCSWAVTPVRGRKAAPAAPSKYTAEIQAAPLDEAEQLSVDFACVQSLLRFGRDLQATCS